MHTTIKVNECQVPECLKKSTGRLFTAAIQALNTSCSKLNKTDDRESAQEA